MLMKYTTPSSHQAEELKILGELNEQVPEHLHTMLHKEDKQQAKAKFLARKDKETGIIPPTCTGRP